MFARFVQTHTPTLLRSARRLTGSQTAAEELLQDTLAHLYPQWGRVQDADAPLAYVRRALTNMFLKELRRSAKREILTDVLPEHAGGRPTEDDVVDRDQVRMLLSTLSGRQRTVLVLRYYHGLRDAEIAEALQECPATVRSLMFRALANLRRTTQSPSKPVIRSAPALLAPSRRSPAELTRIAA